MTVDLDELERLEKAATPGPWHQHETWPGANLGRNVVSYKPSANGIVGSDFFQTRTDEDAEIIVTARNALPALIAELRQLRKLEKVVNLIQCRLDAAIADCHAARKP